VAGAAPKAIQRLFEEKVCIAWSDGAAVGRSDDVLLVIWENGLAEGLADIAGFSDFSHLRGNGDDEAEFDGGHDRCEANTI